MLFDGAAVAGRDGAGGVVGLGVGAGRGDLGLFGAFAARVSITDEEARVDLALDVQLPLQLLWR